MVGSNGEAAKGSPEACPRLFHLVMIKPTHYDDDGYPIQWLRSAIPSNTLACLNGLAEDARARDVLGPDVDIRLDTYDETNRRIRPDQDSREQMAHARTLPLQPWAAGEKANVVRLSPTKVTGRRIYRPARSNRQPPVE